MSPPSDLVAVDLVNASPKTSNLKFFAIMADNRRIPVGFLKLNGSLNLKDLRSEIAGQIDCPSFLLGEKLAWTDIEYSFLYEHVPVSEKQELTLSVPQDYPSLEVEISAFPELISKKIAEKEKDKSVQKALPKYFQVISEDVISCRTGKVIGQDKYLRFNNDAGESFGATTAQVFNQLRTITGNPTFYTKEPKVKQDSLFYCLPKLQSTVKGNDNHILKPLVEYLEVEFEDSMKTVKKMISENQITFSYLWYIFPKESKFSSYIHGEQVGSTITDHRYQQNFFGSTFSICGNFIRSNGICHQTFQKWFTIDEFDGLLDIKSLPFQPMTDEKFEKLVERGKIYQNISLGVHYLQYTGSMTCQHWFAPQKFKAEGRIMLDAVSFNRFNPNINTFRFSTDEDSDQKLDHIPEEKLFMTWPTVPGFSFAAKKWGEFTVARTSPVIFDHDAFDRLVLDPEKKRLIKCLVQNSTKSFTDIISGKGGGVIFLCHGSPGTGKTLTAEAVSELLHRPLYCVNIGELGVTTTQLEEKLSQILEVASTWNAIILLDEADIFLEKRTENDIERNALVGIFLRLLEYHQGVMFLTTNRVKSFDEAFHSRISIALHYQPLDREAKKKVWQNLLAAAKIDADLNPDELAEYDINGRQIKNIIRLVQTIAYEEKKTVCKEDIAKCVMVAKQFQDDLKQ